MKAGFQDRVALQSFDPVTAVLKAMSSIEKDRR